jgi:hypothetical protein
MMKRNGLAILSAAIIAAMSAIPAGAADLPSPEDIFAKYVEATGGADAYAKLKNQVTEATFALPDMGMEGPMVTTVAAPNTRTSITFDAFGTVDSGVTDGVAWSVNPMEGSKILEGDEAAVAVGGVAINPFLNFKGEAETVGEGKVGDEDCYKVDIAGVGTSFFSKESGLLLQADSPMGTATMSDYKEVDGIKIAHSTAISGGQMGFEITVNSVKHNVDLGADTFALPDEIKALMPDAEEASGVTAKQVMEMMDSDSDGKITMEEAPEQLKGAFSMVDTNADGAIDVNEAEAIANFMNNQ